MRHITVNKPIPEVEWGDKLNENHTILNSVRSSLYWGLYCSNSSERQVYCLQRDSLSIVAYPRFFAWTQLIIFPAVKRGSEARSPPPLPHKSVTAKM